MCASMFFFVNAFSRIPLADVIAISLLSPLLVSLLAVPLLKERLASRHMIGLLAGFGGALIVVRPGASELSAGMIWALAGAFAYSGMLVMNRLVASHNHPLTTNLWAMVVMLFFASWLSSERWVVPDMQGYGLLLGHGIINGVGHVMIIFAMRYGQANVITPFTYSAVPIAAINGYLFFGALPAANVWLGSGLMVAGGLWVWYREYRLARRLLVGG
jgi:drug/metabolite transporter (DMT)-like permease